MQILPFGIAGVIFSAACISGEEKDMRTGKKRNLLALTFSVLLCGGAGIALHELRGLNEIGERWYNANVLFYSHVYDACL